MVAAPVPRTWADLEIPPFSTWNLDLYATWDFLLNPPMVKVRQTTAQSIPTATWTGITFQVEDIDNYGFHSAAYPKRLTPTVPGYYVGYCGASFAASTVGQRVVALCQNSETANTYRQEFNIYPTTGVNMVMKGVAFGPLYMNGTTDYLALAVYQNSGAAVYTQVGSGAGDYEEQAEFYMRWWSNA